MTWLRTAAIVAALIFLSLGLPVLAQQARVSIWPSELASGSTPFRIVSAATTNATSIKATPGNVYDITCVNQTATKYYLKFYNKASAPTCNTDAVYAGPYPIPASTDGNGFSIIFGAVGREFTTGIAACITGGSADNDASAAATGVFCNGGYK